MKRVVHSQDPVASIMKGFLVALLWGSVCLLTTGNWQLTTPPLLFAADGDTSKEEWQEANPGYQFSFPHDHAAHPQFRIEWWYYTGNLETQDGKRFGYQLTFFRTGVVRNPEIPSRWAVRDLYMAHFALSDTDNQTFHVFERLNRAGINWAGAASETYQVWNDTWEVRLEGKDHILTANDGKQRIQLRLTPEKPEVLHGENGFSQKGTFAGNASQYYSLTRLRTVGKIWVNGQEFSVTGWSWMDHEFGTNFLEKDQIGWDWFSLQLDDGRELMLFQIRRADGSIDPHSSGTLVDRAGKGTHLRFGEFSLSPGRGWRSPTSGATYPIKWTITLPRYGLFLEVSATFPEQELHTGESTGVTYWEGSVTVTGSDNTRPISGRGYLEMTGYAGKGMGAVLGLE